MINVEPNYVEILDNLQNNSEIKEIKTILINTQTQIYSYYLELKCLNQNESEQQNNWDKEKEAIRLFEDFFNFYEQLNKDSIYFEEKDCFKRFKEFDFTQNEIEKFSNELKNDFERLWYFIWLKLKIITYTTYKKIIESQYTSDNSSNILEFININKFQFKRLVDDDRKNNAVESESEEKVQKQIGATMKRRVLALTYMLDELGMNILLVEKTKIVKFINFLTGDDIYNITSFLQEVYPSINNSKLENITPRKAKYKSTDRDFIKFFFKELNLKKIIEKINEDLNNLEYIITELTESK